MSTRAVYSFFGDQDRFNVYKHSDGYPMGALDAIKAALPHAWGLPRYEADEFAAAFVAGNKSYWINLELEAYRKGDQEAVKKAQEYAKYNGGGVRLLQDNSAEGVHAYCDIEYRYEIRFLDGELYVKAFSTNYWDEPKEDQIFQGTLKQMEAWVKKGAKPQKVKAEPKTPLARARASVRGRKLRAAR